MGNRLNTLAALVLFGIGLHWAFSHREGALSASASERSPPGWADLAPCSETTSFDGKKTLLLSMNLSARVTDRSVKPILVTRGEWSLVDADKHVYRIDVEGSIGNYSLVAPPDAEGCMLAMGIVSYADLRHSWFSVHLDEGDLVDPP